MFKLLKEKIKSWASKNEEKPDGLLDENIEIGKKKKPAKKEKINTKKTPKKEEKKKKNPQQKKEVRIKAIPDKMGLPEKEGFLKKLFHKKEKTAKEMEKELKEKIKKIEEEEKEAEKEIREEEKREEIEEEIEEPKKSIFKRKGLTEDKFEEVFDELEMVLIQNNVALETIDAIRSSLKEQLVGESRKIDIEDALKNAIKEILINPPNFIKEIKEKLKEKKPYIICFVGINGAGKTTSIAKIAHLLKKEKLSVCLAAGDTFRAASIEQIEQHANKLSIPLIKKDYNTDPASVGFEAIKYATKNKIDVVLIDTAGRMNTKDSLMKELEKIVRVTKPDLKLFTAESITGNDATEQAKSFNETANIDGIILSKADIDEKGGTAISISHVTKKPIYFLGTGQAYEDLETFNKEKIIKAMFE